MKAYLATLNELQSWVLKLSENSDVFFPKKTGKVQYQFELLEKKEDVQFMSYEPTATPPVKMFMPAEEELMSFRKGEGGTVQFKENLETSPRILASVRPCDLKSIFLMDKVFSEGVRDPYYLARRENTSIIGYACTQSCNDKCFCSAVDSLDHTEGSDVMVYNMGNEYLVEAKTKKGDAILKGVDWVETPEAAAKKVGFKVKRPDEFGRQLNAPVETIPDTVRAHWKSSVWDAHVERCFSCGTCNLVCPTCYCFDVKDDVNLDVVSGNRKRSWDACMLPGFAEVAGGHNFRPDPAARQRHRVKKKYEYLPLRLGHGSSCTGCGRCGSQCTSNIDIFDIVNDLIAEGVQV